MMLNRCFNVAWQIGLVGLLGGGGAIVTLSTHTLAQVVADPSIGTVVTPNGTTVQITGGTTVGNRNLFHSFSQFDVPIGGVASFLNSPNIVNIFSRVTGGTSSQIDGIVRSAGTANLFLMNPSGIVFRQNARLDVGGSFVATTANAIQFGDRGAFNASLSEPPSQLLTIDPSALVFNAQLANPGKITVQGDGQGTRTTTNLIDTQNALRVPENRTLALVGGNLSLEGATLKTAGGRIELGSVAPGSSVKLIPVSKGWALDYTGVQNFQDVQLTQQSVVDASGAGSGDIQVQGRQITLVGGSQIEAGTLGTESGGILRLKASNSIELSNLQPAQYRTGLFSDVYSTATGAGGNILIETKDLTLSDGSLLLARTFNSGQGGNISVKADNFTVTNGSVISTINFNLGAAGNISIEANNFTMTNGSFALTSTLGAGNGGNLTIHANDLIEISGANRDGQNTGLQANVIGKFGAQGGNIIIETNKLKVAGAEILAAVFGSGLSGDVTIRATESVELSGEIPGGNNRSPGGIFAQIERNAEGRSGNLTIETKRLSVSDGSKVQTITFGRGNAGDLKINAASLEVFETPKYNYFETGIFAGVGIDSRSTDLAQGRGGNLYININQLSLRGGKISVETLGNGSGGNLFIQASDSIQVSPSADTGYLSSSITGNVRSNATGRGGDISLFAKSITLTGNRSSIASAVEEGGTGQGGDIDIQANSLKLNDRASITARSQGNGAAGNIGIRVNDRLNLTNSNITTSADASSGGEIDITGGKIRLTGDSDISSSVASGINGGGNIRIDADYILALNDSDIFAFSKDGQGGNISLSRAFFGVGFQPSSLKADPTTLQGNDRPDINATGQVSSGTVNTPDSSFLQNGLTQFPQTLIDTTHLLANSCIVRRGQQGSSFNITGSGGLPDRPDNPSTSPFPTGEVRSVEGDTEQTTTQNLELKTQNSTDHPWKIGDPIVEPQGVYQLPDGQLVMSRECL